MHDATVETIGRLTAVEADGDVVLEMDEDAFRAFYDRTARPVWLYLTRLSGSAEAADDLLQETYYRFLRTRRTYDSDAHRRNYLYRIATNLARDAHRRGRLDEVPAAEEGPNAPRARGDVSEQAVQRTDLSRAMARLNQRERALLWLAYAQGSSHEEIADSMGVQKSSVKLLLFRARRRLAALLGGAS
jgi:RNA polymerase sigma-70 factor (ECF subfamily)